MVADETSDIRFDVVELVRTMSADAMSADGNTDISVDGDPQIWVASDPLVVELVLQNLIDNARQHGRTDGATQKITCRRDSARILLQVEDNGPGVDPRDLKVLGQRFFRGATRGGVTQSAGLGLSIVQDIAATFDGTVTYSQSDALSGLAVTVHLKLAFAQTNLSPPPLSRHLKESRTQP